MLAFAFFCFVLVHSSSISWYKNTIFHSQNTQIVGNGWTDCPDWQNTNNINDNITAECISLLVPFNWDDSNNTNTTKTINYFITHVYNSNDVNTQFTHGSFWMLEGGPGSDGLDFYPHSITFMKYTHNTYDVYIPSHRGTGHSSPLYCPTILYNTETKQECINYLNEIYGNDIHYYSTYSASMDLGYVIDLFKQNMTRYSGYNNTVIYSLSYGTYYLNQYLLLFPNQSSAVIMDGICPSDRCRFAGYDNNTNTIGTYFVTLCDNNIFCSSQFSVNNTAYDVMVSLWENNGMRIKQCIDNMLTFKQIKFIFFTLLRRWNERLFIAPILYRLNRCNTNDINALRILSEFFKSTLFANASNITYLLRDHIPLSELYYGANASMEPPFSYEEIVNLTDTYYITPYFAAELRPLWDVWNRYTPNPLLYNKYANTNIPMLLMNGDLDHQTPMYWAYHGADGYNASIDEIDVNNSNKKWFVTIPRAPHFVLERSPLQLVNQSSDYLITCGLHIIASFIDLDNNFVPDVSCLDWIELIDWEGNSHSVKELSVLYFGTDDMWGIKSVDDKGIETWIIVIIVVCGLLLIVILIVCCKYKYGMCTAKKKDATLLPSNDSQQVAMYGN